jgi:aminomethyltransferase
MGEELLKTALYDAHVERGAKMVPFAGWSMPVSYTSIRDEHIHTRTACSLFDVSHMGRIRVTGNDAESFLDRICTRNLEDAEVGRCYYTHICKEDGGILDDVIVSRFEDSWGIVCNASNREKIVGWLEKHRPGTDVELKDTTLMTAMIALQGPQTRELAGEIVETDLTDIKRYRFKVFPLMMMQVEVYRTGYTGEDGYEVVVPAGIARMFLPKLLGTVEEPHPVIKPAGLGARDTLRLEAGMPLYGQELHENVDSITAGQGWCVHLEKDFIGAEAMRRVKERGVPTRLVGLELEGRRIARQHHKILADGKAIGEVTSGTLSPTLGKSIAMAFVPAGYSEEGTGLEIDLGRQRIAAKVVPLPFYKRPKQK